MSRSERPQYESAILAPMPTLSERQRMVLRAVSAAYIANAQPASSTTVSHLLPVALSSASIRSTMAELASLGLLEKPHASAGSVPTEQGIRIFVDELLDPAELAEYERRSLASDLEQQRGEPYIEAASRLLSERTQQLGFAMAAPAPTLMMRHISLVRVAHDRLLVVLVPQVGQTQQHIIEEPGFDDQVELDRMASVLNERIVGRSLGEVKRQLEGELTELRNEASRLRVRALQMGLRVFGRTEESGSDLVVPSRLAVLAQPEMNDPERIRGVFAAVEMSERLVEVLGRLLESKSAAVSIALGEDLEDPGLRHCAVVAVPYGGRPRPGGAESSADPADEAEDAPSPAQGVLGVIGPSRMDYARIVPLVEYCSQLVTARLRN